MSNNPVRLFDAKGIPIESTGGALPVADSAAGTKLDAANVLLGQLKTPAFAASDSFVRPANSTSYAANKSMNCSLTVTAVSYVAGTKTATLTCNGHPLAVNDRITVAGMNTGATLTNVDGNWVVSAKDTNTFSFVVASTPTGTTPQTGLTITGAVAKCLSLDVARVVGGGVIVSRITVSLPGVGMTGAIRLYPYKAQPTVLVDQATFTLLAANDPNRLDYIDLYPITEGSGSDGAFASKQMWEVFMCDPTETRLYFRLASEGAGTPASAGIVTLRGSGVQLLG